MWDDKFLAEGSELDNFQISFRRRGYLPKTLSSLRLRPARPEALVGKVCRDGESDPANPQWHGNAFYRHMPAEEETKSMPYSYQQEHRCGDKAKDSWCHSPPLSSKELHTLRQLPSLPRSSEL